MDDGGQRDRQTDILNYKLSLLMIFFSSFLQETKIKGTIGFRGIIDVNFVSIKFINFQIIYFSFTPCYIVHLS